MPWLQLIRWQNLLIIFFTQLLAWWCVVLPESPTVLSPLNFGCITLSTVFIAAAGYIINDYFDIRIDSINKPDKVVLEKIIPRKEAIISHGVLNILALLLAGFVAGQAHHPEWILLQVGCAVLLWFYSTDLKR
jgi:4-hydroxybenzoate polyprenyltransferase